MKVHTSPPFSGKARAVWQYATRVGGQPPSKLYYTQKQGGQWVIVWTDPPRKKQLQKADANRLVAGDGTPPPLA